MPSSPEVRRAARDESLWERERKGHYTLSELARHVGVSQRTMQRWLSQGKIPKAAKIASNGYQLWTPEQARQVLKIRTEEGHG